MSQKLTQKQEEFCIAYLETGNATEAYRRSYDAVDMKTETISRKAKELMDNGKITARLYELRKPVVERAQLTLENHLRDLKDLRDKAIIDKQFSAAITAEIARGKASGLYVSKTELVADDGNLLITRIELVPLKANSTIEGRNS